MTLKHTIQDPNVIKAIHELPELYSTDNSQVDRPAIKLFDSWGSAFWVLWEYSNEDDIAFGYCDLIPGGGEIGSVSIAEITELGWRVEQDMAVSTLVEGYASRNVEVPDYLVSA